MRLVGGDSRGRANLFLINSRVEPRRFARQREAEAVWAANDRLSEIAPIAIVREDAGLNYQLGYEI